MSTIALTGKLLVPYNAPPSPQFMAIFYHPPNLFQHPKRNDVLYNSVAKFGRGNYRITELPRPITECPPLMFNMGTTH